MTIILALIIGYVFGMLCCAGVVLFGGWIADNDRRAAEDAKRGLP